MRLLSTQGSAFAIGRPAASPAGSFMLEERGRTTRHPAASDLSYSLSKASRASGARSADPYRKLTTDEIFQIYLRVPDVRSAVDSVVRRVSTADFYVQPVEGVVPAHLLDEAQEVCRNVTRWFRAPMVGRPWQTWAAMVVRDLMLYDATAWEKVKEGSTLQELFPSRGDDWWPVIDEQGRVIAMEQRINGGSKEYDPAEIVYINLFPSTSTPRGLPLIETIITEVIAILRGAERAMLTMDASEIPPGILFLTGVAGKAAEDTIQSFVKDRGKDHKMRVLSFPQKGAGSAEWLRLDQTPKELEMREVIEQIRRTIWRVFGVTPVEMGATDGVNRATAQVQVDVSSSHLITPILELLQETISTQVLPLLVDERWTGLVEFSFDFTRDLTPAEAKAQAETDGILVDRGILTRNEVRATRGFSKLKDGDVPTVAATLSSLEEALKAAAPASAPDPDPDPDPDEGAGPGEAKEDGADPASGGPGEAEKSTRGLSADGRTSGHHQHGPGCGCEQRAPGSPDDLPSDWQPAGRFKGYRTLDLSQLGQLVSRYERTIDPIYMQTRSEVLATVQAAYSDGEISSTDAVRIAGEVGRAIDALTLAWSAETAEMYREAAAIGNRAAETYTGIQPSVTPAERADPYAMRAMGYLTGDDGPIQDIRRRVVALLGEVSRSVGDIRARPVEIPDEIAPGVDEAVFLGAVAHAFDRNRHRVANWSGKLVELSGEAARDGMIEASREAKSGEATEWWVEWVNVGDERVCPTCRRLGSSGFQPLRTLPTVPGGATECGSRDRCVLVYWTASEVSSGAAPLLGGGNTGEAL